MTRNLECGEHRRFAFGCGFSFWSAASIAALDVFQVRKKARQKAKAKGKAAMLAALQSRAFFLSSSAGPRRIRKGASA
jgi:hypothetical protein